MTAALEEPVSPPSPLDAPKTPSTRWSEIVNKLISVLGTSKMSHDLGVSRTTIYVWSRAKCEPRFEFKRKLADLWAAHVPGQENVTLDQLDPRLDTHVKLEELRESRRPWQILAQKIVAAHQLSVDETAASIGVKPASLRGWLHGRKPHSDGRWKLAGAFLLTPDEVDPTPISSRTKLQQASEALGEAAQLFISCAKLLTDSVRDEGCVAVDQIAADNYLEDVQAWLQSAKKILG